MRFIKTSLLLLLAACPDRTIGEVNPVAGDVEVKDIPAVPNRDVDILFLIDNSGSMEAEQTSLRANFGRFMAVLQTIEGGLPNIHVGVVTSNLGQSAGDGVGTASFGAGCANKGDDGAMRKAPVINGSFISDEEAPGGARNRNYSGTLEDAFSAIANVGIDGCGIEQHLGAVKRGLENPANAGFLRKDAKLAIVVIGDEDDCSLAHKSLFEGSSDGKVVNFRCTQGGIECDGDASNLTAPGQYSNCHPKDPSPYLNPISTYVDYLRGLKADPDRDVIVAGIVGDPEPFKITMDGAQPILGTSCTYGDQGAYPAVRTTEFLNAFPQSLQTTICGADLSGPLVQIAALLKRSFGDPCFENTVADLDPAPGLQADCTVTDVQVHGNTETELDVIPNCSLGTIPCWKIEDDAAQCSYTTSHQKLVIDRGGAVPASDIHVKVNCVTESGGGQVQ